MSVNKVILIGNVGSDPEVRSLQGGAKVATFRIATSERFKDRNGETRENTEWHSIVVWGKQAEFVENYVKKGLQLYVEGKLTARQWTDQSGSKHQVTEVKCESIQLLSKKETSQRPDSASNSAGGRPYSSPDMPDDDIPF